ncbi:hypothetical protein B0H19DRAFT_1082386 [Mycena capillaripes]|nr:hypothetical protein B0H19DRAFT_1082386 [Mycena capillaripes]
MDAEQWPFKDFTNRPSSLSLNSPNWNERMQLAVDSPQCKKQNPVGIKMPGKTTSHPTLDARASITGDTIIQHLASINAGRLWLLTHPSLIKLPVPSPCEESPTLVNDGETRWHCLIEARLLDAFSGSSTGWKSILRANGNRGVRCERADATESAWIRVSRQDFEQKTGVCGVGGVGSVCDAKRSLQLLAVFGMGDMVTRLGGVGGEERAAGDRERRGRVPALRVALHVPRRRATPSVGRVRTDLGRGRSDCTGPEVGDRGDEAGGECSPRAVAALGVRIVFAVHGGRGRRPVGRMCGRVEVRGNATDAAKPRRITPPKDAEKRRSAH